MIEDLKSAIYSCDTDHVTMMRQELECYMAPPEVERIIDTTQLTCGSLNSFNAKLIKCSYNLNQKLIKYFSIL